MACRLAQRHTGADFEAGACVAVDTAQLLEVTEPDQNLRIELTPLEVREEVCAAGDKHRLNAELGLHRRCLARVLWPQVAQPREPKHLPTPRRHACRED